MIKKRRQKDQDNHHNWFLFGGPGFRSQDTSTSVLEYRNRFSVSMLSRSALFPICSILYIDIRKFLQLLKMLSASYLHKVKGIKIWKILLNRLQQQEEEPHNCPTFGSVYRYLFRCIQFFMAIHAIRLQSLKWMISQKIFTEQNPHEQTPPPGSGNVGSVDRLAFLHSSFSLFFLYMWLQPSNSLLGFREGFTFQARILKFPTLIWP